MTPLVVWGSGHVAAPVPESGEDSSEGVLGLPRVQVGVGGVPAGLERVEEPLLDLGGDVGVGLDNPVLQVMAEPAGLRDLRHAVGDEPGLVTVPEPVKSEPGPYGLE